jgi:hypothetical protein
VLVSLPSARSIDVQTLLAASQAVELNDASPAGLSAFTVGGRPLALSSASGCTAAAYRDGAGNVVVAFQGTTTDAQMALDGAILTGAAPSSLPGFADALSFAKQVEAAAARAGIPASRVFVTGHSLGGTLAEHVSQKLGLAGAAFAGSGLAGYNNPGGSSNFISVVDKGDPFANFATDSAEAAFARNASPHMDHYGVTVSVGTAADARTLNSLVSAVQSSGVNIAADPTMVASIAPQQFASAWNNHAIGKYAADIGSAFRHQTIAEIAAAEVPRLHGIVGAPVRPLSAADLPVVPVPAPAGGALASALPHEATALSGTATALHSLLRAL